VTYAGGTAKFFDGLEDYLLDEIELVALEYSGHGSRRGEPLSDSMTSMVTDISELANRVITDEPYILFGYSMGALVAYELVAGEWLKKMPEKLLVAGHFPPCTSSVEVPYSTMDDESFVNRLAEFGGIDERFITNKRFWPMFLPVVKHDYEMLEQYDFDGFHPKLNMDLHVLYSEQDTPYSYMQKWTDMTTCNCYFHKFEGTHFFLQGQEAKVVSVINEAVSTQ